MEDKKTVLVIEDDRSLSAAIVKKLSICNFNVHSASTVDAALQEMTALKMVDAVWLDHYLFGEKDGLDFVTAFKAHPEWRNIPIYIVSNTASEDKVRSYVKLGVAKYYVKSDHRLEEIIGEIQAGLDGHATDGD